MQTTRSKKAIKAIKSPELNKMFNTMIGAEDPPLEIVIPKYIKLYKNNETVLKLLEKFSSPESIIAKAFEKLFPEYFSQIREFVTDSTEFISKLEIEQSDGIMTPEELREINADTEKIMDYLKGIECKYKTHNIGKNYKTLKNCNVTQEIIMIAKNIKIALKQEQERAKSKTHNLEVKGDLSDNFILHTDGDSLQLFGFSGFDFKQLWYQEEILTEEHKKYILLFLYIIFNKCMANVELITTPDIDIDSFSETLVSHIAQLKVKFHDCNEAFKAIEDSIEMLKGNFNGYYKDFVISNNPGIIIEKFVSDVASNHKSNTKMLRQFDKITTFFKGSIKSRNIKDEKFSAMFDLLDENLGELKNNVKD